MEELEESPAELRLYSDSSAALAIVNGSSGSWRTRHLRIRAAALTEAVQQGAIQLQHVPGQSLVADGFTKQLGASPFGRFKESLGFYSRAEEVGEGQVKIVKVKKLSWVGMNNWRRSWVSLWWARPVWSWQKQRSWMMMALEESIGG